MFKIPARITTVDYIGVHKDQASKYRSRALSELEILQSSMAFNALKQCRRSLSIDDNVDIECHITFGVAQAVIIIGAGSDISISEYACFCTAYGVLAGRIINLVDEKEDPDSLDDHYANDLSYAADIKVCQKTGPGVPKLIETREIRQSGPSVKEILKSLKSTEFYISDTFYNIPFTDRFQHTPGELVLILAMPLVDYRPTAQQAFRYDTSYVEKQGAWSPETNRRRIVNYYWASQDEHPEALITARYVASTGHTNLITLDSGMWDGKKDDEEDSRSQEDLLKEVRYNPFRILPIPMNSCFTGYK